jgi:dCTP deaminase
MILSDKTIRSYIECGKIIVLPELNPNDIRPVGIRLHLGEDILVPAEHQKLIIDGNIDMQFTPISIAEKEFILQPGQFILGCSYERVKVPRDIVCHVEGRSTVARIGLAIHCTSGIIDGNFEEARTIVFEMKNQGPFDIVLRHKAALAMLIFTTLTTEIEQRPQKQYEGQVGVVAPNFTMQKQ